MRGMPGWHFAGESYWTILDLPLQSVPLSEVENELYPTMFQYPTPFSFPSDRGALTLMYAREVKRIRHGELPRRPPSK